MHKIYEITGSMESICDRLEEIIHQNSNISNAFNRQCEDAPDYIASNSVGKGSESNVDRELARLIFLSLYNQSLEDGITSETSSAYIAELSQPATAVSKHVPITIRLDGASIDILKYFGRRLLDNSVESAYSGNISLESLVNFTLPSILSSILDFFLSAKKRCNWIQKGQAREVLIAIIDYCCDRKLRYSIPTIYQVSFKAENILEQMICSDTLKKIIDEAITGHLENHLLTQEEATLIDQLDEETHNKLKSEIRAHSNAAVDSEQLRMVQMNFELAVLKQLSAFTTAQIIVERKPLYNIVF